MISSDGWTTPEHSEESPDRVCELSADELRFVTKLSGRFASTADVASAQEFIGQERALAALELGLGIGNNGYNIFVSGLTGAEKLETLSRWIAHRVSAKRAKGTG